jgi:hypothetical protein
LYIKKHHERSEKTIHRGENLLAKHTSNEEKYPDYIKNTYISTRAAAKTIILKSKVGLDKESE